MSSESVIPSGALLYSTVSLFSSFWFGCSSSSSSTGRIGGPELGPACGSVSSSSGSSSGFGSFGLEDEEIETGTSPPNDCETKSRREQAFDSQEQEPWLSFVVRMQVVLILAS